MMKKIVTILIFGIICSSGYSDNLDLIVETQKLIHSTFDYSDSNPIHQPETDSIKGKFQEILLRRDRNNITGDYNSEIKSLFEWIYKNGYSTYEDSPDYRRIKMRRAFCYASIALISDHDKAYTFLEYAKLSIIENIDKPYYELLEDQFLGLLLIDIMLKIEENQLNRGDILKLESYLDLNKNMIVERNYSETKELIKKYKLMIK